MTYIATTAKDFAPYVDSRPASRAEEKRATAPHGGFWRSVLNSVWAARQRRADMEIARYLARNGGQLTDSAEREIGRRLAGQDNYRPF